VQQGQVTPNITVVFSVTGSDSATGSRVTGPDGKTASFCYTGVLIGITDVITAFADFNPRNGTREPGEPIGAATKVWEIPVSTPLCEVTVTQGGFIIAQNGDRASFGGNAKVSSAGEPTGRTPSTTDHARPSDGRHPPWASTTFYALINKPVLRRPLELGQYTSFAYTDRLDELKIDPSVGSKGDATIMRWPRRGSRPSKQNPSTGAASPPSSTRTRGPRLDRLLQRRETARSTRRHPALRVRSRALPIDYQDRQHPNVGRHLSQLPRDPGWIIPRCRPGFLG